MCQYNETIVNELKHFIESCPNSYYKPLKNRPELRHLFEYVMNWTDFLPNDVRFAVRAYLTLNGLKQRVVCENPTCNNELPFSFYGALRLRTRHCCSKCAAHNPLTLERREEKCIEKYGVSSISKVKEIKERSAQSFKNRSQHEKKLSLEHSRKVRIEKYGNFSNGKKISNSKKKRTSEQNRASNEKRKRTTLKLYGVDSVLHTKDAIAKANSTRWEKTFDRYINDNPDVEPQFTKEYFCQHGNEELKWKCKRCGHVFYSKRWKHWSSHITKIARCLKCYPLNCRESKTENDLCNYVKSICHEPIYQSLKKIISPYELDIYIPTMKFAIEFNGIYWHSIECNTPANYHETKTTLCENKNISLVHIFELEWKYRKKQVENHIALLLDKNMTNCTISSFSHENYMFGQKFFDENAVSFKNIFGNCLAIHSDNEIIFVAEYEIQNNINLIIKQFCFKCGYKIENAFDKIATYAKTMNIIVHRDRRLWPKTMFSSDFVHLCNQDIEIMHANCLSKSMSYGKTTNDSGMYHMYNSGIELLMHSVS